MIFLKGDIFFQYPFYKMLCKYIYNAYNLSFYLYLFVQDDYNSLYVLNYSYFSYIFLLRFISVMTLWIVTLAKHCNKWLKIVEPFSELTVDFLLPKLPTALTRRSNHLHGNCLCLASFPSRVAQRIINVILAVSWVPPSIEI